MEYNIFFVLVKDSILLVDLLKLSIIIKIYRLGYIK